VLEEATSDALDFWSLSLLLYVGRVVGDLMSGVAGWDEDEVVGFEVDDRSSMLPTLPVSVWSHFWKLWGKELRERWCGSGRASVCVNWTNQRPPWCDLIEERQIALHGPRGWSVTTACHATNFGWGPSPLALGGDTRYQGKRDGDLQNI
jgi:hypothetical protein